MRKYVAENVDSMKRMACAEGSPPIPITFAESGFMFTQNNMKWIWAAVDDPKKDWCGEFVEANLEDDEEVMPNV